MSYIENLTEKDVCILGKICFSNFDKKPDEIIFPKEPVMRTDYITITDGNKSFYIQDFAIGNTPMNPYGYKPYYDFNMRFRAFMGMKFGEQYVIDYAREAAHLSHFEKEKEMAEKRLSEAQEKSNTLISQINTAANIYESYIKEIADEFENEKELEGYEEQER